MTTAATSAGGAALASAYTSAIGFGTVPPSAAMGVISQVCGGAGSTGNTCKYDFIELPDRGASAVDVASWSVQYSGATGTGAWSHAKLTGSIAASGHYLVRVGSAATTGSDIPNGDLRSSAFSVAASAAMFRRPE